MPVHVTTERYYTTQEGNEIVRAGGTLERQHVVKEGDERAAYLLYGAGAEVPEDEARRLGLTVDEAEAVAVTPDREGHMADVQVMQEARVAAAEEAEAKSVDAPPADKAVSRERTSRK